MQISPNVRSNRSRGGGGEGNFPGSAPWCPAMPWLTWSLSLCPKNPLHPQPHPRWLRHPLHPKGLEVCLGASAAEQPRETGAWGEHPRPCSGSAHLWNARIRNLVWLLCPARGRAEPWCCLAVVLQAVPCHVSPAARAHGAAGCKVIYLFRPLPNPAGALPAAAALNKPLSVSLITLGCSSGSARAGLGLAEAVQTTHGVCKDPPHP